MHQPYASGHARLPFAIALLLVAPAIVQAQVRPDAYRGLRVWLRADQGITTDGDRVTRWSDQSGHQNAVANTSGSPARCPALVRSAPGLSGRPAIRFDGKGGGHADTTQFLVGEVAKPFDLNRATIFLVVQMDRIAASSVLTLGPNANAAKGRGGVGVRRGSDADAWFCVHNGGEGDVERLQTSEPKLDERFHILGIIYDKAAGTVRMTVDGKNVDGSIRNQSKLALDPVRYIQIGGHGVLDPPVPTATSPGSEWYFGGHVAEILVFDRVLTHEDSRISPANELNVVGYDLQKKYGLGGQFVEPIFPRDTDGDGIADHVEDRFDFLDKNKPDGQGDYDGDGLTDGEEIKLETALDEADSDGDGLSDGAEARQHKTDPLLQDSDGDALPDGAELKVGTDPLKKDTDGDRYLDGAEILFGWDPLDSRSRGESYFDVRPEEVLYGSVVVARDGSVLLFEEQREKHQVEVKRSEDGGDTWSEPIVVGKRVKIDGDMSDDGRYRGEHVPFSGLGNVVVDESTGDVLVFASNLKPAQVLYRSKDHGETWRTESIVIRPDAKGWLSAPLNSSDPGITLRHGKRKGRLLVPTRVFVGYLNKGKNRKHFADHYSNALYSDDGGKTWTPSTPFPIGGTGESGLVELRDGRIYHNSRTHIRGGNRRVAWSDDSGETWRDEHEDDELFDGPPDVYGCKGALIRLDYDDRDILLFSTPGRRDIREDITVFVSFDGGENWPIQRLVRQGPGNYTWLAEGRQGTPSEGKIYLLSGKDWLARFNLAWLLERTGNEK